jgi:hypothetical protein
MSLSSLVISIELAKTLYDYNIRYVSCFYWYQEKIPDGLQLFKNDTTQFMVPWKLSIGKHFAEDKQIFKILSAYCSSELGEMMPKFIESGKGTYSLSYVFRGKKWEYSYNDPHTYDDLITVFATTEQDARAKLLIEILKAKYIDVSQTIIK